MKPTRRNITRRLWDLSNKFFPSLGAAYFPDARGDLPPLVRNLICVGRRQAPGLDARCGEAVSRRAYDAARRGPHIHGDAGLRGRFVVDDELVSLRDRAVRGTVRDAGYWDHFGVVVVHGGRAWLGQLVDLVGGWRREGAHSVTKRFVGKNIRYGPILSARGDKSVLLDV